MVYSLQNMDLGIEKKKKIGYRITWIDRNSKIIKNQYKIFIDGWLNEQTQQAWGRPVDVINYRDGLLLSDDSSGTIYRVYYQ